MAIVNEIVGFLKLKGGENFSRDLNGRLVKARESFLNMNKAIAGTGFVLFLKNANDAANALAQSNRQLAATSKLTGIDLAQLSSIATTAEHSFKLSTQQANQFTIAVSKLTGKAGALGQTGDAIGRLLDLAAAQGLDAEQALTAIGQAILGIDEGTDKLFQKNPSAIYEEYAKQIGTTAGKLNDQEKAQALLNAVMTDGLKVNGDYAKFLDSAEGKQQKLNTQLQKTNATLGTMAQNGLMPLLELFTQIVEWFNNLETSAQRMTVALGATTTALFFFGGAIRALLGPWGLAITAATIFLGLLEKLPGRIDLDAAALQRFGAGLQKLSTAQAEQRLKNLQAEVEKVNKTLEAPANRTDRVVFTQFLQRKNLLLEEIKLTQDFIKTKKELEKPAKIEAGGKTIAPTQRELDAAKERLDKQREFEFETNRMTRANYLAYLQTRLGDFAEWSDEWIGLQKKVYDLQKETSDQAQKTTAEKEKNRLQIELDGMAGGREQALAFLQQRQTDLENAGRKYTDEWMQIHQEAGRLEKEAGEARQRNFENSIAALDRQAKFEAETNQISRGQYLDYLRSRLDDYAQWSEEWISRKREILQLETDSERQAAEAQRAIWQQQRDLALSIAGDLSNGVAAIGQALAESFRSGGNAFKAFWKAMLTTALEAIQRYFLLAKIKKIIEAALNPLSALKDAAPLIIASGLLQVAKAQIAALAEGAIIRKPTLALIGEVGQPEIVAPQRDFMSHSAALVKATLDEQKPTAPATLTQKIKTLAEVTLANFKNIAAPLQSAGGLKNAGAQMMTMVENIMAPLPALAGGGFSQPPIFELPAAPRSVERPAQREARTAEYQPQLWRRNPDVKMTINFNTPLNDRRTATRLTEEVLRPEVQRERRRSDRFLDARFLDSTVPRLRSE